MPYTLDRIRNYIDQVLNLARQAGGDSNIVSTAVLLAALEDIRGQLSATKDDRLLEFSADSNPNFPELIVRRVLVVAANTEYPGPDQPVPPGYRTTIRQRYHNASVNGYISGEKRGALTTDKRIQTRNNDSIGLNLSNMNKVYFSADTARSEFEVIANIPARKPSPNE